MITPPQTTTASAPFAKRLEFGQEWEDRVADRLADHGLVIRCCDLPGSNGSTVPVGFAPDGPMPLPDLFVFRSEGSCFWVDPKRKARPSYRRTHRQWEVGSDYAYIQGYKRIQRSSNTPVYLVVLEDFAPADPSFESRLEPSKSEFCVSLDDVLQHGQRRADWPGGKRFPKRRGKDGQGGWLWPRSIMHEFDPAMPEVSP